MELDWEVKLGQRRVRLELCAHAATPSFAKNEIYNTPQISLFMKRSLENCTQKMSLRGRDNSRAWVFLHDADLLTQGSPQRENSPMLAGTRVRTGAREGKELR